MALARIPAVDNWEARQTIRQDVVHAYFMRWLGEHRGARCVTCRKLFLYNKDGSPAKNNRGVILRSNSTSLCAACVRALS